jgi:hypothetical protein
MPLEEDVLAERTPPKTLNEHVAIVRRKLQDYAQKNELTGEIDYDDQDYADFVMDALEEINDMDPETRYTIATFPKPSLLYKGGIVHALMSSGIFEIRNQLDYNDNGISYSKRNKGPTYLQIATNWRNEYYTETRRLKQKLALQGLKIIGISSEFRYRGRRL